MDQIGSSGGDDSATVSPVHSQSTGDLTEPSQSDTVTTNTSSSTLPLVAASTQPTSNASTNSTQNSTTTATTNPASNNNSQNSINNNNIASQISSNQNSTTETAPANQSVASNNVGQPLLPLTRARMRENLDNQDLRYINNIEEQHGCHESARKARFSTCKLQEDEHIIFMDLINNDLDNLQLYFYTRDRILEQWFANVNTELTKRKAYESLEEHVYTNVSDQFRDTLFSRVFEFLDRTGRINYGILEFKSQPDDSQEPVHLQRPKAKLEILQVAQNNNFKSAPIMASSMYQPDLKDHRTGRVIVIGAGLSGLMAARQLKKFGFEVIVLESRNRVGGRVHTHKKGGFVADLGPSSLNGVVGNPVVTLGKQLELCVMELKQKIPVYENKVDKNGATVCHAVDVLLERAVEREYNKIMEGTRVMKNNYKITKYQDNPFPVGMAVDWVMKLQEKNIKDDQVTHLQHIENLYQLLIESANKKLEKSRVIKELHGQLCSIKDSTDIGNHKDKGAIDTFNRRCLARDLNLALTEYKLLIEQEEEIYKKIDELNKSPPSDTYLSLSDRRLLDWHFAELEYALGCPINKLGIYYEDDEDIFDGSHWMIVNGFSSITEAMKTDLDIRLGTAVRKIDVHKFGCTVTTYQPDVANSQLVDFTADAVLCTLPLGVLQDGLVPSQQAAASVKGTKTEKTLPKGYHPVIFSPPLPKWKVQSLNRLGCGNLNKIVMHFDKAFWNQDLHLFGVVNHKAISRGEFFLFWHHGRTPILTGLISGEAADMIEKYSDYEILERCCSVLKSIWGASNVPNPKDYIVTRWRKDPWARGAWSYLQTGSTGDDYDACATPVVFDHSQGSFRETRPKNLHGYLPTPHITRYEDISDIPRLFFAGEHTTRYHFASAHGAVITGLREAARIANIFKGCPYDPQPDAEGIFVIH